MAQRINKDSVSKQFVRLFYSILNTHHEHLHQFYGKSSTIVVSEMLESGETMTETAEDEETCRELLKWLYEDVTIKVESAVPQFTMQGCVLLLVNGMMFRKSHKDERLFTQALLLAPQDSGYYIRTDSLHVLSRSPTGAPLVEALKPMTGSAWEEKDASGCESPKTPRTENADRSFRQGTESGRTSVEITSQGNSYEIQTATPPPLENSIDASKSSGSEANGEEFPQPYLSRTLSHASGDANHPQILRQTIPPPMHSMPPMMMANMHMVPHMSSMGMGLGMPPAPPQGLRRRSMSCDIRTTQPSTGHGVFIARLPFGIQAKDVAEAFQEFGPIVGGTDGIQVRDGRNGCYAFVNFVSMSSAESAIQKGATVQGKRVYVEPRYQRTEAEMIFPVPVASPDPAARPPLPLPRRTN